MNNHVLLLALEHATTGLTMGRWLGVWQHVHDSVLKAGNMETAVAIVVPGILVRVQSAQTHHGLMEIQ